MKEEKTFQLIIDTAEKDERIRAVIMNGSRANPKAPKDIFQDFDIVYYVTDVESFTKNHDWIDLFGERMILQMPDSMGNPPPTDNISFAYLIQLADGNRIDLSLFPVSKINKQKINSQSILLLDKDDLFKHLAPASDRDYLPIPPTASDFADSCNEFWWVCPYVAKGLWREEITYAKHAMDHYVRDQLMLMLTWYVGIRTEFLCSPGKSGKYLKQYLEPSLWNLLEKTYSDADYNNTWDALEATCELFRTVATKVATHFNFQYLSAEDKNVSAYLRHIRSLPKDATRIY